MSPFFSPLKWPVDRLSWGRLVVAMALSFMLLGAMGVGVVRGGFVAMAGLGGAWLFVGAQYGLLQRPFLRQDLWAWPQQFIAAFLLLAAGLSFLSPLQGAALHAWLKVASILISLAFLFNKGLVSSSIGAFPPFRVVAPWVLVVGFAALDLVFISLYAHPPVDEGALTKLNRGATYGLLFLWPVLAALGETPFQKRRFLSFLAAFALFVFPALILTHSRAGQVGFLGALLFFPLAYYAPRFLGWILGCAIAASGFWPFAARALWDHAFHIVQKLPDSWRARVEIWDYLSYRIAERPLTGWGLGAVPRLSPATPHGELYLFTKGPPAHAHNYLTSLGVDLGLLGLLVGVAVAFGVLRAALSVDRRLQPYALSAFIVGWGLALVAYDFWTDSLLAAFVLCGFWFAGLNQAEKARI